MNNIIMLIICAILAQSLAWFQTNGQFVWESFKRNPLLLSVGGGTVISYMFIVSTRHLVMHFDGLLWPGRLVGFGTGMIIMGILTWVILGEGISTKTLISLILATTLVALQVFWK